MVDKTWVNQPEEEVEKGVELLKLCHKLQSEKDGVDRPAPLAIDQSKTLDQFTKDVNSAITWMGSIIQLYPQSQQLAAIGRKLEADGKIEVAGGESYSEAALAYLCLEHGLN